MVSAGLFLLFLICGLFDDPVALGSDVCLLFIGLAFTCLLVCYFVNCVVRFVCSIWWFCLVRLVMWLWYVICYFGLLVFDASLVWVVVIGYGVLFSFVVRIGGYFDFISLSWLLGVVWFWIVCLLCSFCCLLLLEEVYGLCVLSVELSVLIVIVIVMFALRLLFDWKWLIVLFVT